ncbi:MAG: HAMP domain-containing histidine kinase [Campylobacterales bacterium]|nr:HAMP domain-containing histidine kinase [Campylobacterales bacterium]
MKNSEKRSLIRFSLIYFSGFLVIFSLLFTFYYIDEKSKLTAEALVEQRIEYNQCMKLNFGDCQNYLHIGEIDDSEVIQNITVASIILLIVGLAFSITMGYFAIRPMREASEKIDDFIGHIVHDINTPLSVISLNVNSLLKKSDEKEGKKLKRIKSSTDQLVGMQHSLLATLKEDYKVIKENFSLNSLVDEILEDFKSRFPKETLTKIENHQIFLDASKEDFKRILENLISNSIKYNKNHNEIFISINEKNIEIKDNGLGIKNPEMVFEKYYRENTQIKGTGIGLHSCKNMVERNGFEMSIESLFKEGSSIKISW